MLYTLINILAYPLLPFIEATIFLFSVNSKSKQIQAHNFFVQLIRNLGVRLYALGIRAVEKIMPTIFPKIPDKSTKIVINILEFTSILAIAILTHIVRFSILDLVCHGLFLNGLQNTIMCATSIVTLLLVIIINFIFCQINYGLLFPVFYNKNGEGWFTKNISIPSFIRSSDQKLVLYLIYGVLSIMVVILFNINEVNYAFNWICNLITSLIFNNIISIIIYLFCALARPDSDSWEGFVKVSNDYAIGLIKEDFKRNEESKKEQTEEIKEGDKKED